VKTKRTTNKQKIEEKKESNDNNHRLTTTQKKPKNRPSPFKFDLSSKKKQNKYKRD